MKKKRHKLLYILFSIFIFISSPFFAEDNKILPKNKQSENFEQSENLEQNKISEQDEFSEQNIIANEENQTEEIVVPSEENQIEKIIVANETKQSEETVSEKSLKVRKPLSIASLEDLDRPEVEKFRKQYLSPKWTSLLYSYLENAMEYRLYVRKTVQDREMPEVLEYLPVVESNYKTNAKSKSGAIGMWQFMENSVKPFLILDDFIDERLDPWKSTDGALRKLTDNFNYFNDWKIAIAAYNCGAGAMTRVLKKAKVKDFWYLVEHNLLPKQTADYVPKLIAISDLAINSEYYGIDLPSHDEEFLMLENEKNGVFDYLETLTSYSIIQLANEMRMDVNTMKHLNPSFVRGFTHPTKKCEIRLPIGMKQSALDAISKIEPIEFPFKYVVVAGDSLWSISRKNKVSIKSICDLNNIEENAILRIGKVLYIPSK